MWSVDFRTILVDGKWGYYLLVNGQKLEPVFPPGIRKQAGARKQAKIECELLRQEKIEEARRISQQAAAV